MRELSLIEVIFIILHISSHNFFSRCVEILIVDNSPISSFDLRSSNGPGQHWKDDKTLGDRGYVFYEESPRSCKSYLNIERVAVGDSGQYRCRVDYQVSPTRNTRIKLKLVGEFSYSNISLSLLMSRHKVYSSKVGLTLCVVARPAQPVIYSQAGAELGERTHPLALGGEVRLYCTTEGGDPTPTIVWRKDNVPLPAVGLDVDSASGQVRSTVLISHISSSDQGSTVSCTATNSRLVEPTFSSVKLDVIGEIETQSPVCLSNLSLQSRLSEPRL